MHRRKSAKHKKLYKHLWSPTKANLPNLLLLSPVIARVAYTRHTNMGKEMSHDDGAKKVPCTFKLMAADSMSVIAFRDSVVHQH